MFTLGLEPETEARMLITCTSRVVGYCTPLFVTVVV